MTGALQAQRVRATLPAIPKNNVIVEPARRDTLAAVTLGTAVASGITESPDEIVVTTPADSLLSQIDEFASALDDAQSCGLFDDSRLCSFGVAPTRPETGFGYIETGQMLSQRCLKARRFVEKPDSSRAQQYLDSGDYLWNTGSFAWRASALIDELERQEIAEGSLLWQWLTLRAGGDAQAFADSYSEVVKTSIDFGVMENAAEIGVMRLNAEFDDVGTWDALANHGGLERPQVQIDASDNLVMSDMRVVFVGCDNLIVVRNGDDLLVMQRGAGQSVKAAGQASKALESKSDD